MKGVTFVLHLHSSVVSLFAAIELLSVSLSVRRCIVLQIMWAQLKRSRFVRHKEVDLHCRTSPNHLPRSPFRLSAFHFIV